MNCRKYAIGFLIFLGCVSLLSFSSFGQRKSPAAGSGLAGVKRYVGKVANDKVIANPAVRKELIAVMGARRYRLLDHYTLVQSEVDMISGDVVASGCAPHECMEKSALVIVDIDGRKVHAAIFENPRLTIYSREKTFDFLPNGLTDWVRLLVQAQAEDGVRIRIVQK
ncbi:MAG: hypothetical protein H0X08_03270 [Blastocatellia bacterium]|nr:hypothetical protein [Blastocatellia bacterium]